MIPTTKSLPGISLGLQISVQPTRVVLQNAFAKVPVEALDPLYFDKQCLEVYCFTTEIPSTFLGLK